MADSKQVTTAAPKVEAPAPEVEKIVYNMPESQYARLSYGEQRRLQMSDFTSALRNQATPEDAADFQLLSNTPADIVVAVSGLSFEQVAERAEKLGVTLKGSLAGSMNV